ncbi:isoprenylcysteine carboxylmethyltransferase family protein [candidate division KSB1 bacterium]|nr:isoprenylcysteine carboxylmethyltransferase family protein [candidate division KSB1 bacterium]
MSLLPTLKIGVYNAWIFMSVFLLQMLFVMLADRSVSQKTHVPADARSGGRAKRITLIANGVWLIAMLYSIFLPLKLGTIWFYAGLVIFVTGLIILALATWSFLATPADQIIQKGIYRYSRHPMYLATFIICLGTGIAAASWLFLLITVIMVYCFRVEALVEEVYCLNQYGRAYQRYLQRVPRWFGLPRRSK